MLYCFLDTNIFIHCQDIEHIDWKSELGASDVCLVIAPIVFEELDKLKDDPKNDRKRNRARRALKFLEETLDTPDRKTSDGLSIAYAEELYQMEFGVYNLNPNNKDDRLVASAIRWTHDNSDHEVWLVSHDSGPRMKAKRLGFPATKLSDRFKLPDQLDERDKEIGRLKRRIDQLETTQPELDLAFRSNDGSFMPCWKTRVYFKKDLLSQTEIQSRMSLERSRLKYIPDLRNADLGVRRLSREQVTDYETRVDKYIEGPYQTYLAEQSLYQVFTDQAISMQLNLVNSGTEPAADVELSLHVRNVREVLSKSPLEAHMPEPPELFPNYAPAHLVAPDYTNIASIFGPKESEKAWTTERVDLNSVKATCRVGKLKHHRHEQLELLYIIVDEPLRFPMEIDITYEIIADNLMDKLQGQLRIIINDETE